VPTPTAQGPDERAQTGPEAGKLEPKGPEVHDEVPQRPPRWRVSRTFAKYMLLELPGWVIAAGVLSLGIRYWELSPRLALLLFGLWVIKDFALYPVLRIAYEDGSPNATEAMVGALGTARERLDPSGYVRVGSELWRAELIAGIGVVERGESVRVRAVRGLTLEVERA
jgi:membrane protein implicated in regulation of membrane protease activity